MRLTLDGDEGGESVEQMLARVDRSLTADHWKRSADLLNLKGEALRREGVKLAVRIADPQASAPRSGPSEGPFRVEGGPKHRRT